MKKKIEKINKIRFKNFVQWGNIGKNYKIGIYLD